MARDPGQRGPAAAVLREPASAPRASRRARERGRAAGCARRAAADVPAGAISFTGEGFDACAAPSAAYMSAWHSKSSPYGAVGIYIGGAERACAQPNLTAGWVAQQAAAGWRFMPIYVGPQAEFDQITSPASQAVAAAEDAVTQAAALGLGPGTPIYYDMEAYPSSPEEQRPGLHVRLDHRAARRGLQVRHLQQLLVRGHRPGRRTSPGTPCPT